VFAPTLERSGAEVAQRWMASLPIVEELEIVEQRGARQDPRGPRRVVDEFDLQRGEKALDIRPSSLQMLKDCSIPMRKGSPCTTSRSRTCRPAIEPPTCFG